MAGVESMLEWLGANSGTVYWSVRQKEPAPYSFYASSRTKALNANALRVVREWVMKKDQCKRPMKRASEFNVKRLKSTGRNGMCM